MGKAKQITIKFSTKVNEGKQKYLIIKLNDDKTLELNMNSESLNEMDELNNFVLENIIENEIKFEIEDKKYEDKSIQYLVMEEIVKLLEKEYKEVKEDLEKIKLEKQNEK